VLPVDRGDPADRRSHQLGRLAIAVPPAVGLFVENRRDIVDGGEQELGLVSEVDVEGGPRDAGLARDLIDGEVLER
jgi:hypothetical protein